MQNLGKRKHQGLPVQNLGKQVFTMFANVEPGTELGMPVQSYTQRFHLVAFLHCKLPVYCSNTPLAFLIIILELKWSCGIYV